MKFGFVWIKIEKPMGVSRYLFGLFFCGGHWVISLSAPRMTTANALYRKPTAFSQSMYF